MRVQAESTEQIVNLNGLPARIREATTESGVECFLFVTRVAVRNDKDSSQFERELLEQKPPSAESLRAFPLNLVL